MKRNRPGVVFSLSFLDVMSCGLGAVVLLFLIINHAGDVRRGDSPVVTATQLEALETEVAQRRRSIGELRSTLAAVESEMGRRRSRIQALERSLAEDRDQAGELAQQRAAVAQLQEQVAALESRVQQARRERAQHNASLRRLDDGDRQYLTGIKVSGERILFLVDTSASMLAPTIVEIIRRRNMAPAARRASAPWQRTLAVTRWLAAQLPENSEYQIYTYNDDVEPALSGTEGRWLGLEEAGGLEQAIAELDSTLPDGGTNLYRAFVAANALSPPPDNIYLITDSLPTQGGGARIAGTVSSELRVELFLGARSALQVEAPINIVLMPMEGDPLAPSLYWHLAQGSGGVLVTPSGDWP